MARLLVEIDEELKRELKSRLARNGETLKSWLTRVARSYVGGVVSAPTPRERPAAAPAPRERSAPPTPSPAPPPRGEPRPERETEPAAQGPRPPRRYDDYLD